MLPTLPVHPVSRTLVATRVIEQVVLVVPLAVVPLFKRGELGDDRSAFEAVVGTRSRARMVSQDRDLPGRKRGAGLTVSPGLQR